ncbi:putative cytosolic Fe-S cluster assembly factor [Phytophthora fragariae]|uniref:Putative cytosolic Fe-S cluster assembly factor n=1 Tax=Phytophthora fragariae TaxID=53985 RepID=A0A6A4AFU4_9STRA|nr:putative cytosolic Fe-S cluster assembly factor [Phytophthora fragariae]KAE8947717.1 putative cytosolic Fe-S cluster assembly factor [Phytophthora fragariae]KAE9027902.1 putative cytosolic Fe-S cluster assembly factor [Phytophthora fragariae]KAE9135344.1 putative cytosolic Fe-S cluster assembly factor [Phytophthora fragariae]KAE9135498.1 putative cytosolic Fe-S cluster assembly factor [Phytophthora fragariae]
MASVFLGDLNDYIQPSQACVNPLFTSDSAQPDAAGAQPNGLAKITLQTELSAADLAVPQPVKPNIIRTTTQEKATISLDDCLACSGCVTSAETVLISQQSCKEMLDVLAAKKHKHVVMTLSPQSRASLAAHFEMPVVVVHCKLVTLFRNLGVNIVIDSTCSGDFALLESRAEFLHRYHNQQKTIWARPPSSVAVSSAKTEYLEPSTVTNPLQDPLRAMPMLASSCPGWICYAEKSQPNAIPFIDTTKSPQQIAGSIVKRFVSGEHGVAPSEVYHVAVMPCFDKKLEASRKDFQDPEDATKDVDCVLATTEIIELIESLNVNFALLELANLTPEEIMLSGISEDGSVVLGSNMNASSGGHLEHIFRFAAKELFNVEVNGPLEYVAGRNPDFREVTLVVEGKEVLKFAIAYGFRNIQSIMTKIRRNKCPYHYVEIMACPSGCLNGGGQIRPKSTLLASELLDNVTGRFQELQVREPTANPAVKYVYEKYLGGVPFSEAARAVLHTQYHAVPKMEQSNPLGIKW